MGFLQQVSQGQPFRPNAADHNAFIDTAKAHRASLLQIPGNAIGGPLKAGVVEVKNMSETDRKQFEILGIDGLLFTIEDSKIAPTVLSGYAMKGVDPTASHSGKFVVLQEPIPAGATGRAAILGLTAVKLQVDHEGLNYADVKAGDATKLQATSCGAAILYKESGTGVKWGVIDLDPLRSCTAFAVLQEDLEADGEAEAKVWALEDDEMVETDHVIDVHGWMLDGDRKANEDDRILAVWMNGRWEVVEIFPSECTDLRDPKQMPGYVEGVDQTVYKTAAGCYALGETDDDCD